MGLSYSGNIFKKIAMHISKYCGIDPTSVRYVEDLNNLIKYLKNRLHAENKDIFQCNNPIFKIIAARFENAFKNLKNLIAKCDKGRKLAIHIVGPVTAGKTTVIRTHQRYRTNQQYLIREQPITGFNSEFCIEIDSLDNLYQYFDNKIAMILDGKNMGSALKYMKLLKVNEYLTNTKLICMTGLASVTRIKITHNLVFEVPSVSKKPVIAEIGTHGNKLVINFKNLLDELSKPKISSTRVKISGQYINYAFQFAVLNSYMTSYYTGSPLICERGLCDIPTFVNFSDKDIPKKYYTYLKYAYDQFFSKYIPHIVCILPAYGILANRVPTHGQRSEKDLRMIYNSYVKRYNIDVPVLKSSNFKTWLVSNNMSIKYYNSNYSPIELSAELDALTTLWDCIEF